MDTNNNAARDIISALIYPATVDSLSAEQQSAVERAILLQSEYMENNGEAVVRREIGDVSVTYENGGQTKCCGEKISPVALAALIGSGCLSRFV